MIAGSDPRKYNQSISLLHTKQNKTKTVAKVVRHDGIVVLDWEQCSFLGSFTKL